MEKDNKKPEFEREYQEATRRGRERLEALPKAAGAEYDKKTKRLVLNLTNGVVLLVPVGLIQGLQTDDDEALSDFELVLQGSQIHWETLDVQFYIDSFLRGVFGTPGWMAEIGARGGTSRSDAKRQASRENGKKGGRPKKQVA